MSITKEQAKDNMGRFRTSSLFYDFKYVGDFALYVMGEEDITKDGVTYISLRKAYMAIADPTEYSFAQEYFYSWKHWQAVYNGSKPLQEMVAEWRDELEIKLKSQGVLNMIDVANSGTKEAAAASKWLSGAGWDKRKAGAPSKAEKIRQNKIAISVSSEVEDDWHRVHGNNIIN